MTSPANAVKLPPIAITGENESTSGVSSLLVAQGIQEFSLRRTKEGVTVYLTSCQNQQKLLSLLRTKNVPHHTYAPRGGRKNKKFLLMGLDVQEAIEDIRAAFTQIEGIVR
ncbi:hypothetical protein, partial [Klebsiella pneumoniae]|uniref:hypothetical protein n=1 Tax=Klebsiella pneumoniae TaxID=573 RepID=UPI00405580B7